jgi:hypothetical protein
MFRLRLIWKILFFVFLCFHGFMVMIFFMMAIAVLMREGGAIREAIFEVFLI